MILHRFKVFEGKGTSDLECQLNEWCKSVEELSGFKLRRTQYATSSPWVGQNTFSALVNYEIEATDGKPL
jgi:hypothetical protein